MKREIEFKTQNLTYKVLQQYLQETKEKRIPFHKVQLLQNAKYYHIKTHQNLGFLGKFHGGAKKYMDLKTFFRFGLEI